ncbi:MAG: PEP-CTERM sorting domain-containing protein [Thermoguttaceae bacterium]
MKRSQISNAAGILASAAAMVLFSASLFAEVITGDRTISSDTTVNDFYQIGNETTPGNLNITGGTVTFTGSTPVPFRSQNASILVINGNVTISNANVTMASGASFYENAPEGCVANITLNSGATLTSPGYPGVGGELGTHGTLTVNQGATLVSEKALYVSGHGEGIVNLNGGTIRLVDSGLQIARDYDGKGNSQGTFNMTGGTLEVGKYIILNLKSADASEVINTGIYRQTGGEATANSYMCVGNTNTAGWIDKIQGHAYIGGGSETAKLTVGGNFNIGNGENSTSINTTLATKSDVNIYDNAEVVVATGGGFTGIGARSELNVYGGSFEAKGTMTNAGTVDVTGGTLTVEKALTNNADATINVAGGTLNAKTTVANAGEITVAPGLNGWGKMAITGAYSGDGTIYVGLSHGLGLFSEVCKTVNEILTAASGLNAVTNSPIINVTKTDTSVSAAVITEGAPTLELGETLEVNSPVGVAQINGFEGGSTVTFDVKNGNTPLTGNETDALIDWLSGSVALGDATVSGEEGQITVTGLPSIPDGSFIAFDLTAFNPNYMVGTFGSSANVPEPATWAMLLLGVGALAFFRRKK